MVVGNAAMMMRRSNCGRSSTVERQLPKLNVAGSNPVVRSNEQQNWAMVSTSRNPGSAFGIHADAAQGGQVEAGKAEVETTSIRPLDDYRRNRSSADAQQVEKAVAADNPEDQ